MKTKQYCSTCDEFMIAFSIVTIYREYHGYICPVCGFWQYKKKRTEYAKKKDAA